jgi:hypothetical protein
MLFLVPLILTCAQIGSGLGTAIAVVAGGSATAGAAYGAIAGTATGVALAAGETLDDED